MFDLLFYFGRNAPIWSIFLIFPIFLIFLVLECHDLKFERGDTSSFAITEEKDPVM